MMNSQDKVKRIHFIGIGGIGMSALAKYYLSRGFEVSGSDLGESEIISDLRKLGAKVFIGHRKENLRQCSKASLDSRFRGNDKIPDLVIYSAAIESQNPELKEAHRRKIKCQTYAQALGELTKKYFTIAVSGTHGKSTTTAMISLILIEAGFDPTVIVGTKLPEFGNSNFRAGKSQYLVIEADEYDASFLNYWPKIIVLTNIEEDHLDYYRDLNHILKTFKEYVSHLGKDGILVANREDRNVKKIIKNTKGKVVFYSSSEGEARVEKFDNYRVFDCAPARGRALRSNNKVTFNLKIPGRHNLMNAFAALTMARALKIPDKVAVRALNKFHGTWRRFEYKGEVNGAKIFDDYGHHPTEIKATLEGAREYLNNLSLSDSDRRLWCVFQPHQYQRTYKLFDKFINAFDEADKVVLLPIWSVAGREKASIKKKVSSEKLAARLLAQGKRVVYLDSFRKTADFLRKKLKRGDIAVIMGAGDIYKLTEILLKSAR